MPFSFLPLFPVSGFCVIGVKVLEVSKYQYFIWRIFHLDYNDTINGMNKLSLMRKRKETDDNNNFWCKNTKAYEHRP